MREIKFRAWDDKGRYFKNIDDDGDFYFRDDTNGLELWDKFGKCKNVILLQFTGLKDKNGKEIYEGDILNYTFDGVVFIDNGTYVKFEAGAFLIHKENFCPLVSDASNISVLGNIYENPELIKGKTETVS